MIWDIAIGVAIATVFYFIGLCKGENRMRIMAVRYGLAEWRCKDNGEPYFLWKGQVDKIQ